MNEEEKKTFWEKRNNFEMHTIEEIGENEWIWGIPDTVFLKMHIKVIKRMNRLTITGDLGDWVFSRSNPESLLLSTTNKDYFYEKCSSRGKEYSEEKTLKFLKEYLKDNLESLKDELEDWEFKDLEEKYKNPDQLDLSNDREAYREIDDLGISEPHEMLVFSHPPQFDWIYKGIVAFQKAYEEFKEKKMPVTKKCSVYAEKNCENYGVRAKFLLPNLELPNLMICWCPDHVKEANQVLKKLGID